MTCIVGMRLPGGQVLLGGDSAGVVQDELLSYPIAQPKVFLLAEGEIAIGFTSSFRMGQVLQHCLELPETPKKADLFAWMVSAFVPAVRKAFQDAGALKSEEGVEQGGVFLVGLRGRLFKVNCDFSVVETTDQFAACGCGEQLALGALHAFDQMSITPQTSVLGALQAATHFSAGVRPPYHFVTAASKEA